MTARDAVPPPTDADVPGSPAGPTSESGRAPNVSGLIDWSEFWAVDHADDDWLVEPILPRARSVITYAPAGAYKSLLALYVAVRLATGQAVLDEPAAEPINVLYLDLEQTFSELQDRLRSMGYGPEDDLSRFHYYLLPDLLPLDTADGGRIVRDLAEYHQAELVIIDTTSRVISGKENDADTFLDLYRHTGKLLRADGRTVWMLDHAGKDATLGPRGSSAKASDVDMVWKQTDREGGQVRLETGRPAQGLKCRISWAHHKVDLNVHEDPTRIETVQGSWPAGTKELADLLDRLEVPVEFGRRKARKAVTDAGEKAGDNEVLGAAISYRRNLAADPVDNSRTTVRTASDEDVRTTVRTGGQESRTQASGPPPGPVRTTRQGESGPVGVPTGGPPGPHLDLVTLDKTTAKVTTGKGQMPCDVCGEPTDGRINDRPGCVEHLPEAGGGR